MNIVNVPEADIDRLDAFAAERCGDYVAANPFPHISIDDFVRPDLLERVVEEVAALDEAGWINMRDDYQVKSACNSMRVMGPATRAVINFLNGQEVIAFLEKLTGIEGLVADPTLAGGGVQALKEGGFLNIHADFNYQQRLRLDRRINLILYLNKDWREDWGGNMELWDEKMTHCAQRITPEFNRCVIFNTTDKSFHGNPQPVSAPGGRTRHSIAMFYYTNGRPLSEVSDAHMSLYQYRPGEGSALDHGKRLLRRLTPPILADMIAKR